MLELVKTALRVKTTVFDSEIEQLISAALIDLGFGGASEAVLTENHDAVVNQAVITYVKMNFGLSEDYDKLKRSYDEQKAQLGSATGYTEW
ncbi:MAG: DNA-packaging protein [Ruminococcus sp.]|nr:DNA-packaging protein [Ruminococcus sp.]